MKAVITPQQQIELDPSFLDQTDLPPAPAIPVQPSDATLVRKRKDLDQAYRLCEIRRAVFWS